MSKEGGKNRDLNREAVQQKNNFYADKKNSGRYITDLRSLRACLYQADALL